MPKIISYPKIYAALWKELTMPVDLALFEERVRNYFYNMSLLSLVNITEGKVERVPLIKLENDFIKLLESEDI